MTNIRRQLVLAQLPKQISAWLACDEDREPRAFPASDGGPHRDVAHRSIRVGTDAVELGREIAFWDSFAPV